MKMVIDGITYQIKTEIRFRFPKWKIVILIGALTLFALGYAHASPDQWSLFSAGGGNRNGLPLRS